MRRDPPERAAPRRQSRSERSYDKQGVPFVRAHPPNRDARPVEGRDLMGVVLQASFGHPGVAAPTIGEWVWRRMPRSRSIARR
jgi:hypothetical protein